MTKESQESKDWFGGDFGNNDFGSSEPASRFKKKDPSQIKITKRSHGHTGSNKNSGSFKMTGSDPTTAPNSNNAGAFVDDTKQTRGRKKRGLDSGDKLFAEETDEEEYNPLLKKAKNKSKDVVAHNDKGSGRNTRGSSNKPARKSDFL